MKDVFLRSTPNIPVCAQIDTAEKKTERDAKKLFRQMDTNSDGTIDVTEFVTTAVAMSMSRQNSGMLPPFAPDAG